MVDTKDIVVETTKVVVDNDEYETMEFNIAQHVTKSDSGERILYGCQTPMLSVYASRDIKAGEGMLCLLLCTVQFYTN